eukprot:RCo044235
MMFFFSNDLVILMAFSGQKNNVTGNSLSQCQLNSFWARMFDTCLFRFLQTGTHIRNNGCRIFSTRIIVSQNQGICPLFGYCRHLRSFTPVTITATAKQAEQMAVTMLSGSLQGFFQTIRRMCIIDHDQWLILIPKTLHAASHRLQAGSRLTQRFKV